MIIKSKQNRMSFRNHSTPDMKTMVQKTGVVKTAPKKFEASDYRRQIQNLKNELDVTKKSSYEDGFKAGKKIRFEGGINSIEQQIQFFTDLIKSINQQQDKVVLSAEKFVLAFVLKALDKIVGSKEFVQNRINHNKLEQIISDALKVFPSSARFIFHLNRESVSVLEEHKAKIIAQFDKPVEIAIVDDSTLNSGDCMVETDYGVLDARLDSHLEEIKKVFLKR